MNDGSRCLRMMAPSSDPATLAAITKSLSRSSSSLPRTTRASPVQPTIDRIRVMPK